MLRDQPDLFGKVASTPTAWRTLEAVDAAALNRIAHARAAARANAWAAGRDPGFYVIDFDATLVIAHSEKEQAAANYKHTFGFHPLLAFLDATGEALAGILRPGNAGSNTAADHVELLDQVLVQLPVAINQAWLTTALIAHDLLAWTRMITLDGDLARAEPKKLRYCLLHAAGLIARTGRRTRLRIANNWPWSADIVHAFARVELIART